MWRSCLTPFYQTRQPCCEESLGDPNFEGEDGLLDRREGQRDDEPSALGVGRLDRTAMGLDDLPDDRQAQARPVALTRATDGDSVNLELYSQLEFVPIVGMLLIATGLYLASQYVFARKEMK